MRQERERATDATVKAGSAVSREITQLRDELTKANTSIEDLNKKIAKVMKYILIKSLSNDRCNCIH